MSPPAPRTQIPVPAGNATDRHPTESARVEVRRDQEGVATWRGRRGGVQLTAGGTGGGVGVQLVAGGAGGGVGVQLAAGGVPGVQLAAGCPGGAARGQVCQGCSSRPGVLGQVCAAEADTPEFPQCWAVLGRAHCVMVTRQARTPRRGLRRQPFRTGSIFVPVTADGLPTARFQGARGCTPRFPA